jgi:hypothetical protein
MKTLSSGVSVNPMDSGASVPISTWPARNREFRMHHEILVGFGHGRVSGCDGMSLKRAIGMENSVPNTLL